MKHRREPGGRRGRRHRVRRFHHDGFDRHGPGGWNDSGGWDGCGPRRGRGGRARRGEVRASILVLLTERPMHGYELIQELSDRTDGMWKPSPGSIYPTLSLMEDEGLIVSVEADGKKAFDLSDAGREEAAALTADGVPPWSRLTESRDQLAHELRSLYRDLGEAVRQVSRSGTDAQKTSAQNLLKETRRALYLILAE
ncbi:MAG: PadR family transcriptional regulator [Stackebrandtia sp.]